MNWFQVIVLAVVQGLTEFLPISSSGHLVILQKFFGFSQPPILFDILVHVGTLGAVIFYFRKGLAQILIGLAQRKRDSADILWLVLIGTVPAAVVGGLLNQQIELAFNSLKAVGFSFLFTSLLLFSTRLVKVANKQFNRLNWLDALIVGLLQAVAILPGVSRSGSTIVVGLWRGAAPEMAFRFSFYLAIPAIFGALILKSGELFVSSSNDLIQGLAGMMLAGIIGYFALRLLERLLKSAKLFWFGFYCLILGLVLLLL